MPPETEATTRSIADRYFQGVTTDAVRSSLALLAWMIDARREGKRVVAVPDDALPERYEEPVLLGLDPRLASEPTWLVERRHPWRRQPWIKGRRLVAGDLARTVEIEGWTPEEAARQYDLPVDAVLEAQRYLADHRALVLAEEQENAISTEGSRPRAG